MESVEAIEVFSPTSARYRYRVPVGVLRELRFEGSRYSGEFEVGGWMWRFHIQERPSGETAFLALHLQNCSAGAVQVHFKLSVICMQDPLLSRSKTFHCTFKKAGSAWGLHQFIPMNDLLQPESGFIYTVDGTGTRCIDFEATLQVQPPDAAASNEAGAMPRAAAGLNRSTSAQRESGWFGGSHPSGMLVPQERSGNGGGGGVLVGGGGNSATSRMSPSRRGSVPPVSGGAPYAGHSNSPGAGALTYNSNNNMAMDMNHSHAQHNHNNNNTNNSSISSYNNAANGPLIRRSPSRSQQVAQVSPRPQRHISGYDGGGMSGAHTPASMLPSGTTPTAPHEEGLDYILNSANINMYTGSGGNGDRPAVRASLMYPFEHLESLCDMCFDVQGVRVKAHRCVIGARMRPLLPEQMLPLQSGCIVAIAVPLDVFTTFLRYVYTEEYPEPGVLPAESVLDLYLLSAACEFFDLCNVCLRYVYPLLTTENILPIVLTRYNAADEVLTAVYLRVLLQNYDALIQDKQFEEIPGHLFRRLSLILYKRESVPNVPIPAAKNSLGKQLAWLAETGEYSDYEWTVGPQQHVIRAHRYILASRCTVFSQTIHSRKPTPLPIFTTPDFDFSLRSWQKLLAGIYRHHLLTTRDFSAEDIAIVFKMHNTLGLDGNLKREADEAFTPANALRLLIYAVKHQISELHERAVTYVASNFKNMIRGDPQAWELIGELPQSAVVSLFRTVTEHTM